MACGRGTLSDGAEAPATPSHVTVIDDDSTAFASMLINHIPIGQLPMAERRPGSRSLDVRVAALEERLARAEGDVVYVTHLMDPLVKHLAANRVVDPAHLRELVDSRGVALERVRHPLSEAARIACDQARARFEALSEALAT